MAPRAVDMGGTMPAPKSLQIVTGPDKDKFYIVDSKPEADSNAMPAPVIKDLTPKDDGIEPFNCVDGDWFMLENIPPREPLMTLVDKGSPIFCGQSINQVFAWRGLGKTCIGFALVKIFANGATILNWKGARRAKVLYVDGELPASQAQERWKQIIGPTNGYAKLITIDKQAGHRIPSLASREGMAKIEKTLADLAAKDFKVEVLILDSISTLFNVNANDEEEWTIIQSWLTTLRSRGLCIIFFHHSGKSGLSRSHSKSEDMLDVSIRLSAPEEPEEDCLHAVVHYDKARAGYAEPDYEIKMKRKHVACLCTKHSGVISCSGDSVTWEKSEVGGKTREDATRLFVEGKKDKDIASELDVPKSTVRSWRKRWKTKGGKVAPSDFSNVKVVNLDKE